MYIVFCFDKNYEQHFGVALTSVLLNNIDTPIDLYIITDIADEQLIQKLTGLSKNYKLSFDCYTVDKQERLDNLKVSAHISQAAYYRLLIPELLPKNINRVLYLDSDLVVNSSLEELYELEIDDYLLAAEGSRKNGYFNSGVMLINLERWRNENISEKTIEWAKENEDKLPHWDQSALNHIVGSDFLRINKTWNFQVDLSRRNNSNDLNTDNAKIVHFIGSQKPWYFWIADNRKQIYQYYLNKSLWSKSKLEMISQQMVYLQKSWLRKFRR